MFKQETKDLFLSQTSRNLIRLRSLCKLSIKNWYAGEASTCFITSALSQISNDKLLAEC